MAGKLEFRQFAIAVGLNPDGSTTYVQSNWSRSSRSASWWRGDCQISAVDLATSDTLRGAILCRNGHPNWACILEYVTSVTRRWWVETKSSNLEWESTPSALQELLRGVGVR